MENAGLEGEIFSADERFVLSGEYDTRNSNNAVANVTRRCNETSDMIDVYGARRYQVREPVPNRV